MTICLSVRVRGGKGGIGNNDPEVPVDVDVVVIDSLRVSLSLIRWTELEVPRELRTSPLVSERAAGIRGRGVGTGSRGAIFETESCGLNELLFMRDEG